MSIPKRIEQVLTSVRPTTEISLNALQAAAVLAGYEWFASEGRVFFVRTDAAGDYEEVGRLGQLFGPPTVFEAEALQQVDPTTLLAPTEGPSIFVFDDFYADPLAVRADALASELVEHPERHKGCRSPDMPINPVLKDALAELVSPGRYGLNGYTAFQLNVAGDQRVFHSDTQRWAAAIYLTPSAPPEAGLGFYRSTTTLIRSGADLGKNPEVSPAELEELTYGDGAVLDRTRWREVDRVGNVFNRLVVWNARLVHSVSEPFGHDRDSGRLTQLFFFDPS